MSSESNIVLKTTAGGIATLLRSLRGEDFALLLHKLENVSKLASGTEDDDLKRILWEDSIAVFVTFLDSIPGKYVGSESQTADSSDGSPMPIPRGVLTRTIDDIKTGLSSFDSSTSAELFKEVEARKVPMPKIECAKEGTSQVQVGATEEGETHDGEDQVSALTNDPSSFDISNGSV